MIWGAWICLLSPLAAACLITLGGRSAFAARRGYLATSSCFVAFGGAVATFVGLLRTSLRTAQHHLDGVDVDQPAARTAPASRS